jgi:hypothetical protein
VTALTYYDRSKRIVPWSRVEERDGGFI